jgi:acyl-coenzyme A thioesterase PaaI-like protein
MDAPEGAGAVTASFNGEFVDAAREGEIVEARGEVVRGGASLIFVRGLMTSGGRPIFNFSAILKRIRFKQK